MAATFIATPARSENAAQNARRQKTATPIKHVIVLIGENRTFDHVFATYVPKSHDSISNLLSKGIIHADGTPGRNFNLAAQFQAVAPFRTEYFISLNSSEKAPYTTLPSPTLNFAPTSTIFPTGTLLYDSHTGDTTHRLLEMWQQSDCNVANGTRGNPSGCLSDLYPFVITNYTNQPDPFAGGQIDDNGGGNSMAFYNVQKGDAPVLKRLADQYTISDNFHQ